MSSKKEDVTEEKETCRHGIPMDEKSLKEWQQSFKDIDDSIKLVMKGGKNL
jgi:hypothetical protein